jgi:hypothetical protein
LQQYPFSSRLPDDFRVRPDRSDCKALPCCRPLNHLNHSGHGAHILIGKVAAIPARLILDQVLNYGQTVHSVAIPARLALSGSTFAGVWCPPKVIVPVSPAPLCLRMRDAPVLAAVVTSAIPAIRAVLDASRRKRAVRRDLPDSQIQVPMTHRAIPNHP